MFRLVSRLAPHLKPQPTLFKTPQHICAIYKPNMFFSSTAENVREVSPIAASFAHVLRRCQTFSDLFYHFDKRDRFLTFNHLALMVRKFHDFHQNRPTNVMLESNYNQIISRIVNYCEQNSSDITAGDIATIYFCTSNIPYSNQFTKRCNFVIEQKGVALFQEMNPFEVSLFFMTLAKNKKRGFAQTMIPYITEHIQEYKLGILTKTLNSVVDLEIKAPQLAERVKKMFLTSQKAEKLRAREYCQFIRFFSQYSDIEGGAELFRRLESRFKWISRELDGESINTLINALAESQKPLMSLEFYEELSERVKDMESEIERDSLIALLKHFSKNGLEYLLTRNDMVVRMVAESGSLNSDALTMLLYYLSKNRTCYVAEADTLIQNLMNKGPVEMDALTVEQLLTAYNHFSTKRNAPFLCQEQQFLLKTLLMNLGSFSLDKLSFTIMKNVSIFGLGDQRTIFKEYQAKILNHEFAKDPSSTEIKNLCNIAYIFSSKFPELINQDFLSKIIEFSLRFMDEQLNSDISHLHARFFENFGKFLNLILTVELDATYLEKRTELLNVTGQFIVKIYEERDAIPEELLVEKNLISYIRSFYSVLDAPSQEVEKIFAEALSVVGPKNLNSINAEFVLEKTPLVRESVSIAGAEQVN